MGGGGLSAEHLIDCAQYLHDRTASDQTQSDLKRAISTLYYSLFHELASTCADIIAGPRSGDHSPKAWKQCFRALEHGHSKTQCRQVSTMKFPSEIKNFANHYATMQVKRHQADYHPDSFVAATDVRKGIKLTKRALSKFRAAPDADKRAFCAFVLLKKRAD